MISNRFFVFGVLLIVLAIYQLASVDGVEEESVSSHKMRVKRAFENMDPATRGMFSFLPLEWILELVGCIAQDVSYLRCDFNFSIDIFYILDQCVEDPQLRIVLKVIERAIPAITFPAAIPPTVSNDLCYKPLTTDGPLGILDVLQNYIELGQANIPKNPDSVLPILGPGNSPS